MLQNRIDEPGESGGGYKLQLIHSTIVTTMEKDFASSLGNNLKPKGHFLRFKKQHFCTHVHPSVTAVFT